MQYLLRNARSPGQSGCFRSGLLSILCLLLAVPTALADGRGLPDLTAAREPGQVLIKLQPGLSSPQRSVIQFDLQATVRQEFHRIGVELWSLPESKVEEAIRKYHGHPDVAYIEPNYHAQGLATPTDLLFSQQWGLNNTGQTLGTLDADIDAPAAWDIETGSGVVVAVLDSGLHFPHPDLQNNLWTNPGEIAGNGIDDDGNGFIDDIHGYDFVSRPGKPPDADPTDDRFHGTHVTGILAADTDNGIGVAGVAWSAEIMVVKIIAADNGVVISEAISGLEYALDNGARLSNHSWGGGFTSQAMEDAVEDAKNVGHLVIAGAGNDFGNNNDVNPFNPASYAFDNVISVAATDHDDDLAIFSNIGANSVDLGAPGLDVFSTFLPNVVVQSSFTCGDPDGDGYGLCAGTSMSTPFVTGVATLLWSADPTLTYLEVRNLILDNVDPKPALLSTTASGGRLNAANALLAATTNHPPVAVDDFFQMAPNTVLDLFASVLLANDFDPDPGDTPMLDGCPLTAPNGSICGCSPAGFSYCPNPGFFGEVVIPYTITDGTDDDQGNIFVTVGTPLFDDGFEVNGLNPWDNQVTNGAGILSANSMRPMDGLFHMAATVSGGAGDKAYVVDQTPNGEDLYRAFFLLDANRGKMLDGNLHRIFVARDDSPATNVVMVDVRRNGLTREVRARARQNNLTWVNTPWTVINGTTKIDLRWSRDTGSGGSLTFLVDGVTQGTLTGLNNGQFEIDRVFMGIISGVDPGTQGAFYFDSFESFGG